MTKHGVSGQFILAFLCCLLIVIAPASIQAQGVGGVMHGAKKGIQKGAGAVQKGAEGAAEKTKEGGEAVGKGVKKSVTGDENKDTERQKNSEVNPNPQEPRNPSSKTSQAATADENLPKTAGELPLLGLIGAICLAAVAKRRTAVRKR